MGPQDIQYANFILNAIQVGGLIGFMTLAIVAFMKGWIYPASVVEKERQDAKEDKSELKENVKELTGALAAANNGMERMADAWEARNQLEREQREWDRRQRNGA